MDILAQTSFLDVADYSEPLALLNSTPLTRFLRSKGRKIGRYGLVSDYDRQIVVRPCVDLPIKDTELATYLEAVYANFYLTFHDSGAATFTLGPNGRLKPVLDSLVWGYEKFMPKSKDVRKVETQKAT